MNQEQNNRGMHVPEYLSSNIYQNFRFEKSEY